MPVVLADDAVATWLRPEVVDPDVLTGLLVPADEAMALSQAMQRLADAPELRARFAAAARKLVVEKFAADIIGRQTVELYRGLLDSHGTSK